MSTRPDLFPPHIIAALTRLQDNVGAFGWSAVERTVLEDLGKPIGELFASFDREPIGVASGDERRASIRHGDLSSQAFKP